MRDIKRRRRTTLLKDESVRPKSCWLAMLLTFAHISDLGDTYGPRSGKASRATSGKHCRSLGPCDECFARGERQDRYLL
jgi:hypothetical protein